MPLTCYGQVWGGVCSIIEYLQRKTGQVLGTPLLFFGSERVWTVTASEQPTGHSGLTSKAEWRRFQGHSAVLLIHVVIRVLAHLSKSNSWTFQGLSGTIRRRRRENLILWVWFSSLFLTNFASPTKKSFNFCSPNRKIVPAPRQSINQ